MPRHVYVGLSFVQLYPLEFLSSTQQSARLTASTSRCRNPYIDLIGKRSLRDYTSHYLVDKPCFGTLLRFSMRLHYRSLSQYVYMKMHSLASLSGAAFESLCYTWVLEGCAEIVARG